MASAGRKTGCADNNITEKPMNLMKSTAIVAIVSAMALGPAFAGDYKAKQANQANQTNPPASMGQQSGTMQQVTEEEAIQLFDTIDANSDSKVTQAEWKKWQSSDASGMSSTPKNDQAMMSSFKTFDADNSGELEKQEFVQAAVSNGSQQQGSTTGGGVGSNTGVN